VSVVEVPAQIVEAVALMLTTGVALTVIVFETTVEQPLVVPVTEYVDDAEGLTVMLATVAPLLHI
jgi:hypothetical protein